MKSVQVWDNLSGRFDMYRKDMWYGVADNIYTIWPVVLRYLKKHAKGHNKRALDFGCGTGMFCNELAKLGFSPTGIDSSPKMIRIAKKHLGKKIQFIVGDSKTAASLGERTGKFDVIVSIMVMQFVKNISKTIQNLIRALETNGHLIIVVHSPQNLAERGVGKQINIGNTGNIVSINSRDAREYEKLFNEEGCVKTIEEYLYTSSTVLRKYHMQKTRDPKYMVLGFKRVA